MTAIMLLIGMFLVLPYLIAIGVVTPDLGLNLYSEGLGLFSTLLIFIVLLELREKLEWRSVKNRVKKRIGRIVFDIFYHLKSYCIVEQPDHFVYGEEVYRYWDEKQLNTLASKVRFRAWGKEKLRDRTHRTDMKSKMRRYEGSLGRIEERYSRHLGSKTVVLLMDLQRALDHLDRIYSVDEEEELARQRFRRVFWYIRELRNRGFWVHALYGV